jgi:UDP-4-amino-4-deoxy-L-arabinose-oxoglutarate aminotransferase
MGTDQDGRSGRIPHSRPTLGPADQTALAEVLAGGHLTHGPRAERLGAAMAARLGRRWGIAVQSGTDALTAALALLDLPPGAPVGVPAYSCTAPLDAIAALGLTPVPIDIDRETLAISPPAANACPGLGTIIAAHLFGIPAPLAEIRHPAWIEDCAQTLPAADVAVGRGGRLTTCSFYATKLLATGHGGLLAGDDPADCARAMDLFRHDQRDTWRPHLHFLMSDLDAALGLAQLARLDEFIAARRRLAERFSRALGIATRLPAGNVSRFLVEADPARLTTLLAEFADAGIEAKRPVHLPIYRALGRTAAEFPGAAWADATLLSVPLYPAMAEAEAVRIEAFLESHRHDLRRRPSA